MDETPAPALPELGVLVSSWGPLIKVEGLLSVEGIPFPDPFTTSFKPPASILSLRERAMGSSERSSSAAEAPPFLEPAPACF